MDCTSGKIIAAIGIFFIPLLLLTAFQLIISFITWEVILLGWMGFRACILFGFFLSLWFWFGTDEDGWSKD